MKEPTMRMLTLLENTKFSATNDLQLLKIAVDLLYLHGKAIWQKGTKEREALLALLSGKIVFDHELLQKRPGLDGLVAFLQGAVILTMSLLNGIGRPPLAGREQEGFIAITVLNKTTNIKLQIGLFNEDFSRLLREFKIAVYGQGSGAQLTAGDLRLMKQTFSETKLRLNNEKVFLEKLERDPTIIFKEEKSGNFTPRFFSLISALPVGDLNNLLINVGSYLPNELEETNEDMFRVKVRNYFSQSTQELHELFKKVRLLLKLYTGKQKEIVSIIVREKTKELFGDILQNKQTRLAIKENLNKAKEHQFNVRIDLLTNLVKLL